MSFLLAQLGETAPDTKVMALICVVPTLLGALIFHFLNKRDKADLGYRLRLLSLVPVLVGVVLGGILSFRMATDFAYQQYNLIGKGREILHYAVLVVNLAGAIGIFVWNSVASKGPKYDF